MTGNCGGAFMAITSSAVFQAGTRVEHDDAVLITKWRRKRAMFVMPTTRRRLPGHTSMPVRLASCRVAASASSSVTMTAVPFDLAQHANADESTDRARHPASHRRECADWARARCDPYLRGMPWRPARNRRIAPTMNRGRRPRGIQPRRSISSNAFHMPTRPVPPPVG